jgi:hypothetical protein
VHPDDESIKSKKRMEKTFQGLIISLLNYTEIFGGFKNFLSYYLISYFYFMVGIMAIMCVAKKARILFDDAMNWLCLIFNLILYRSAIIIVLTWTV